MHKIMQSIRYLYQFLLFMRDNEFQTMRQLITNLGSPRDYAERSWDLLRQFTCT